MNKEKNVCEKCFHYEFCAGSTADTDMECDGFVSDGEVEIALRKHRVTAESAIKAFDEANTKIKNNKLVKMINEEREKVAGYEQIARVHSAYISILLNKLEATKDNPVAITASEVTEALKKYEARAMPAEDGYSLYCEVIE